MTRAIDEEQKNFFKIISSTSEISKQQIAELKKEINELRQSTIDTENLLAHMEQNLGNIGSWVYLGFLSRKLTNHRTVEEGGGNFFNSLLPFPPASQTLRHWPGDYCRELTAAHS